MVETSNGGGLPRGFSGILFQTNSSGEHAPIHLNTLVTASGYPYCPLPCEGTKVKLHDKRKHFEFLADLSTTRTMQLQREKKR